MQGCKKKIIISTTDIKCLKKMYGNQLQKMTIFYIFYFFKNPLIVLSGVTV